MVLGARVRYSARDKGHEEGGSTYVTGVLVFNSFLFSDYFKKSFILIYI